MEKKKRPPIHEAIIERLNSPYISDVEVMSICYCHGDCDSHCPGKYLPGMIAGLENLSKKVRLKNNIAQALTNLRVQLEEFEAEERKKTPPTNCPNCGSELEEVTQPENSPLNYDQWAAVRRGDLRCTGECKKFYFFTNGELKDGHND
jgi:hypothetical protein